VLNARKITEIQNAILEIPVSDHVVDYAVNLVRSTRPNQENADEFINKMVSWGAGPRASLYLILAAKTRAALYNRLTPSVNDVKQVAEIVLQHRILTSFAANAEGLQPKDIIKKILSE
jgi:MoxR-like ATPase